MYDFIDIDEHESSTKLPSEALKINGLWLEQAIPGYRTLNVSGRELLETEIDSLRIGHSDRSKLLARNFPTRTITVRYQLKAESNKAFREAFNKLNSLLNVENAELIFNDEQDKLFIGTKAGVGSVPSGVNSVVGEFDLECNDPFKYSVEEFSVKPTLDGNTTFNVDYKGTYKSHPIIEASVKSDNGFIGYVNDRENVLQFGDPQEADGTDYKQNEQQAVLSNISSAANDNGTNYMHPGHVMSGYLNTQTINGRTCLRLASLGTVQQKKWCGGMKTFTLPKDSEGNLGAQNFYCYLNHWIETGLSNQTGEQSIAFLTSDNKVICGYSLFKTDMNSNTAAVEFWGNGKILRTITYQPTWKDAQNPYNEKRGSNDILKEGSKLRFYWFGSYPTFNIPEIANMKCAKIQVAMTQYVDGNRGLNNTFVTRNYLRELKFQKLQVTKWKDVPNKFANGDKLTIDCSSASVEQNGLPKYGLGAYGNEWEDFYLEPGTNQIKCAYSFWATKPDFTLKYREVFI